MATQNNDEENRGDMSVRDAGKKGGEATSRTHGHEFYSKIGHKGGEIGGPKGGAKVRRLVKEGEELEEQQGGEAA